MELHFPVQTAEDTLLLRDFLRKQNVSAGLMTQVKAAAGFWCTSAQGAASVPIHTNERVHAGQTIWFALPPERETSVQPQALPIAMIYEDAHAMVLNKPAGQTVHPTRGYADGTLANAFCGAFSLRGGEIPLFRPVNRLDRNTSGLVLCAMNAYAAPLLAKSAEKVYFAIVEGEMPLGEGEIDAPIAQEARSIIKRCVAAHGKPSLTRYTVLCAGGGFSFVRCIPVTGRTHQIRVHLAYKGHPLAGDDLYGGATVRIARHALHCGVLSFCLPQTAQHVCFTQPLPPDMEILLRFLSPHRE